MSYRTDSKANNMQKKTPGSARPIMVSCTVNQYAASGVAGLHIEDQVQTKRCGHLAGNEAVDTDFLG